MGRLHGRVTDPSGAVLVHAVIVVIDALNHRVETKTDAQGQYRIDRVTPGLCVLTINANGFAEFEQAVTIGEGQDETVDATLAIAVQHQEIAVEAEPAGGVTDPAA